MGVKITCRIANLNFSLYKSWNMQVSNMDMYVGACAERSVLCFSVCLTVSGR